MLILGELPSSTLSLYPGGGLGWGFIFSICQ